MKVITCLGLRWSGTTLEQLLRIERDDGSIIDEWQTVPTSTGARIHMSSAEWDKVDWSLPNRVIANQLGKNRIYIAAVRRKLGVGKATKGVGYNSKYAEINWDSIDWTENNNELGRQLGINPGVVRKHRIRLGKPLPEKLWYGKSKVMTPEKIESIDWLNRTDMEISKELRVSRERIRQIRDQYKKPRCKWEHRYSTHLPIFRWLDANRASLEGKRMDYIIDSMPFKEFPRNLLIHVLKQSGLKYQSALRKGSGKLAQMAQYINWELPNAIITIIWNMFLDNAVTTYRNRHFIGRSKWFMTGFGKYPPDLRAAAYVELEKARQFGSTMTREMLDEFFDSREMQSREHINRLRQLRYSKSTLAKSAK